MHNEFAVLGHAPVPTRVFIFDAGGKVMILSPPVVNDLLISLGGRVPNLPPVLLSVQPNRQSRAVQSKNLPQVLFIALSGVMRPIKIKAGFPESHARTCQAWSRVDRPEDQS